MNFTNLDANVALKKRFLCFHSYWKGVFVWKINFLLDPGFPDLFFNSNLFIEFVNVIYLCFFSINLINLNTQTRFADFDSKVDLTLPLTSPFSLCLLIKAAHSRSAEDLAGVLHSGRPEPSGIYLSVPNSFTQYASLSKLLFILPPFFSP